MSQAIYLTDEQYALLQAAAAARGQTPEETLNELLTQSLAPSNHTADSEELDANQVEAEYGPLLRASGILTEEVVPGWYDHHDEAMADDALDPHED
jgi:hypothetical protein